MSRLAIVLAIALVSSAYLSLQLLGYHLPNPPMNQLYSLSLGWRGKCLICRHAMQYLSCLIRTLA